MYAPFDNASQFRLFDYFYGRSDVKSQDDFNDLVGVLRSDGFKVDDLKDFTAKKAEKLLDDWAGNATGVFSQEDGWHTSSVFISLPKVKGPGKKEEDAPQAEVKGVIYRRLLDTITGVVTDTTTRFARQYHWIPHIRYWIPDTPAAGHSDSSQPESSPSSIPYEQAPASPMSGLSEDTSPRSPPSPIRIWTDCYNSDAMLAEDAKVRGMPRIPGDDPSVEYAVLPLLLWSDETHLSSFGSAYMWPIYLYFGSISKYVRGRPTEFAAHHLAYIPQLPDTVKDDYQRAHNKFPDADTLTFCKRELYNQIWHLLLDPEFCKAYKEGLLLRCGDGVLRRLFPRFFTYSADYPEKVLIAALKPLARCLCPRCLTEKTEVSEAGTAADEERRTSKRRADDAATHSKIRRARELIFRGYSLTSKRVKKLLEDQSLNPIRSAFSTLLSDQGLDVYQLLAPDLMHEFELGVWKNTFAHLMRILEAPGVSGEIIQEFNNRFAPFS
ncbi:hypothetical protein C8T65DRAFT_788248 [Cerioporus squamosus]|nr:hypothetical protein C8T65DRAFT_788248 [Cerioporus squamosus]